MTFRSKRRFPVPRAAVRAPHKRGTMNQTEKAYAAQLDIRCAAGEIAFYWFEALTLRLGTDGLCNWTPDFLVQLRDGTFELHEVKGPRWEEDARVKVKTCARIYPFTIHAWQRTGSRRSGFTWTRETFEAAVA